MTTFEVFMGLGTVCGLICICFELDYIFNDKDKSDFTWAGFFKWLIGFITRRFKNDSKGTKGQAERTDKEG